ncbi:MAG: MSMEG_4193 family putative phosphomutase [Nocardioides sp.]
MPTVVLLRHGRTTANTAGVLAGRQGGVHLDEAGRTQAARAAQRLAEVPLAAVVSSPLVRCRETAAEVLRIGEFRPELQVDRDLTECDYGEWQGRSLKTLAKEELWTSVQQHPASVVFPGGESMRAMQSRAVAAIRSRDQALGGDIGPETIWVAVSHGDLIKAVLADALGLHLDLFQRIQVDPGSMSIIRYSPLRPFVLATNTHAGELAWLAGKPPKSRKSGRRRSAASSDAAVGGGAGPGR